MPRKTRLTRRDYLKATGVFAAGVIGLNQFDHGAFARAGSDGIGYGPLEPDPDGILDLPAGFKYTAFSRTGDWMDDGLKVPGAHDGMAAFPGPNGMAILVRNHELQPEDFESSCHLLDKKLTRTIPRNYVYDRGRNRRPAVGGTTTLVYDVGQQKLKKHFLSLTGTTRNCAGGPTPWNTWLTCEETVARAGDLIEQDHGYVFEVPAKAKIGLASPIPYKAMGRFNHEAVAVDARTGIVYLTEDCKDGLFYRFLPNKPGKLEVGGRLQALRIKGQPAASTRNWSGEPLLPVRQSVDVEWVDMENVESPDDDLRYQGAQGKDAAIFTRGEGIWYERGIVYFACTDGGTKKQGQIFRYRPSEQEGNSGEESQPGQLEIFSEPNNSKLLQSADNLTVAPWGDLIVCEDGSGSDYLVGITPHGQLYRFAGNVMNDSELAGSVFSPDGSTLFVNIQDPGITLAITGPWHQFRQG